MELRIINSSSKANATLVIQGGSALLIDCGVSFRALNEALITAGLDCKSVRAVLITHSHSDHIGGLSSVQKKLCTRYLSAVDIPSCDRISGSTTVGDFTVTPFRCSHDVPCVGYRIDCNGESVAIATDTGVVTDEAKNAFENCKTVMLESNHDKEMLKSGPYPPPLKARISSDNGHLSNTDCAAEIVRLASKGALKTVILAHLSEHNNTPLLARKTTEDALRKYGFDNITVTDAHPHLSVHLD